MNRIIEPYSTDAKFTELLAWLKTNSCGFTSYQIHCMVDGKALHGDAMENAKHASLHLYDYDITMMFTAPTWVSCGVVYHTYNKTTYAYDIERRLLVQSTDTDMMLLLAITRPWD